MAFLIKVLPSQNSLFQKGTSQLQLRGRQVEMDKLMAAVAEEAGEIVEQQGQRDSTQDLPQLSNTASSSCIQIPAQAPVLNFK